MEKNIQRKNLFIKDFFNENVLEIFKQPRPQGCFLAQRGAEKIIKIPQKLFPRKFQDNIISVLNCYFSFFTSICYK